MSSAAEHSRTIWWLNILYCPSGLRPYNWETAWPTNPHWQALEQKFLASSAASESTQLPETSTTPLVLQRTASHRRECEMQLFSNEESKHRIPRKTITHDFSYWFQFICTCRNSLRAGAWINRPIHTWVAIRCHSLQETSFNGVGCPVSYEQLDLCAIQCYSSVQCMSVLNHSVFPEF